MSTRALARLDLLKGYLHFLEGKGLIDFSMVQPFDFTDVALGFASSEPESWGSKDPAVTTADEDQAVLANFSEDLDGDGYMVAPENPLGSDYETHEDLVNGYLNSIRKESNVLR